MSPSPSDKLAPISAVASNTKDCFRACVGLKCVGVLFDALPNSNRGLAAGTKTLVFEGGWGLTISSNGSFWTESVEEVHRAVERKREELKSVSRDLQDVIDLAGVE